MKEIGLNCGSSFCEMPTNHSRPEPDEQYYRAKAGSEERNCGGYWCGGCYCAVRNNTGVKFSETVGQAGNLELFIVHYYVVEAESG